MKNMNVLAGLYTVCFVSNLAFATQSRYVYTLFQARKTWNEAKQICDDQLGQLLKAGNRSADELIYLDTTVWNNVIQTGDGIWNGIHKANINDAMWKYQDCDEYGVENLVKLAPPATITPCAMSDENYVLHEVECNETHAFVCQRYLGECWYEPFPGQMIDVPANVIHTSDPADCAQMCNNYTNSIEDCWAFVFFPVARMCILQYNVSPTFYLDVANRYEGEPENVLYIRRCFEGLIDLKQYSGYVNQDMAPALDCINKTYDGGPVAQQVCFCSTEDKPPIPAPLSDEDKVEQLIKELALDASNTSSAVRKLTSAEDNRPSAIGVGFVGVGLLTGVFGALLLLDMGRFFRGVKAMFQSPEEPANET